MANEPTPEEAEAARLAQYQQDWTAAQAPAGQMEPEAYAQLCEDAGVYTPKADVRALLSILQRMSFGAPDALPAAKNNAKQAAVVRKGLANLFGLDPNGPNMVGKVLEQEAKRQADIARAEALAAEEAAA